MKSFCFSKTMLSTLLLLILPSVCQATITLTATGQHFASSPDEHVGVRFLQGFEYLARLQVFSQDLELCPDDSTRSQLNLTVNVPPDGLPVAILARNTGCSVETKARLASYSVEPPHKLKYLILYGDDKGLLPEEMYHHYHDRDLDISVGILHISERSGNELLWTISNQSNESKTAGGPRLLLDGNDSSRSKFARDFTLWMGISVMMMACIFSFFLSLRAQQGAFRSTAMEGAPAARERPRRLSPQQVQELVPEYMASDLIRHDEESHHHSPEMCSICLDEYAADEYVAELPCGHVFHSSCIGKWLTERSSTCPLCKTDLMPDDDDDASDYVELQEGGTQTDSSDDASVNLGVFSFMDRVFATRPRTTWWRRRRQQRQDTQEQEMITDDEEEGVSQQPLLSVEHDDEEI